MEKPSLHDTMDAQVWTKEFMSLHGISFPDEGNMLGWFTNAIMAGYDQAKRENAKGNIIEHTMTVLGDLVSEEVTLREINSCLKTISTQNLRQSAALRLIIEERDQNPERYQKLLHSMHSKLLAIIYQMFAASCEADSRGLMAQALGVCKHIPAVTVADNEFGRFVLDQLGDYWVSSGIMKADEKTVINGRLPVTSGPNGKPDKVSPGGIILGEK